jgi:hypothetical protein
MRPILSTLGSERGHETQASSSSARTQGPIFQFLVCSIRMFGAVLSGFLAEVRISTFFNLTVYYGDPSGPPNCTMASLGQLGASVSHTSYREMVIHVIATNQFRARHLQASETKGAGVGVGVDVCVGLAFCLSDGVALTVAVGLGVGLGVPVVWSSESV